MTGGVALQALVTGLSVGAVYGLVAMGFTVVQGLTRVFALAHGDVVVGAVFVAVLAVVGSTPVATDPGAGTALGLVVLMLLAGVALSLLGYVVAVRPFLARDRRGGSSSVVGWAAGSVAFGLAIREVLGLKFSAQGYAVPDALHLDAFTSSGVVHLPGGTTVPVRVFGVLVIAAVIAVVTDRLLVTSRYGAAVRAVSVDADAAALVGVPVERVVLVTFAVAGLLAGVAGLLYAPGQELTVDAGVVLGLKGAAAAVLGRLGSLRGAVAAGLVIGVLESFVVAWSHLGAAYGDVVPLAVLLVLLALPDRRAPREAVL
jgi:branched-chain amino acid transport system permease protein